jgi:endoglucanase
MVVRGRGRHRRLRLVVLAAVAALVALAAVVGVTRYVHHGPRSQVTLPLFTDPHSGLVTVAQTWAAAGNKADAKILREVASVPAAIWAAGQKGDIAAIGRYASEAAKAHKVGQIVVYNIPRRDRCGQYSAKGGLTAIGYEQWIDQLVAGIKAAHGREVVVVEPDALPDMLPPRNCLRSARAMTERFALLHYAMQHLGELPNTQVFLDAGNPGMIGDPAVMASATVRPEAPVRPGAEESSAQVHDGRASAPYACGDRH